MIFGDVVVLMATSGGFPGGSLRPPVASGGYEKIFVGLSSPLPCCIMRITDGSQG